MPYSITPRLTAVFCKRHRHILPAMPLAGALLLLFSTLAASAQSAPATDSCANLAHVALPQATITLAQSVAAGAFQIPQEETAGVGGVVHQPSPQDDTSKLPAFCRIGATLSPSSDSSIRMELWLPLSGWNHKFVGVSNMGWGGAILYRSMLPVLASGYALAANDTGHTGNSAEFAIGHPEKLIDFAYRANHEMTLKAKALIKAFYGSDPLHSIWIGCSLGGMQALMEARRYPDDYDGIIAGAPINPITLFNASQLWPAWVNEKYPEARIPGSKFSMIHEAILKSCASPIGQKQGFVDDPGACNFDPGALLCKGDDAPDCLTAAQVEQLRRLYAGPVNPRTHEAIFPGPPFGAEIQWSQDGGIRPSGIAMTLYKYVVFHDPNWDWKTMDYDKAIEKATTEVDPLLRVDANLNGFLNHGGKLMIYIGWTESHNPKDVENYYHQVLTNAGPGKEDQLRLFEVPGMNHCGGGNGCSSFEKLATMDKWLETGKAPDEMLGAKIDHGQTVRTRPICAYPKIARYKGAGSEDEASSFVCTSR